MDAFPGIFLNREKINKLNMLGRSMYLERTSPVLVVGYLLEVVLVPSICINDRFFIHLEKKQVHLIYSPTKFRKHSENISEYNQFIVR